MEEKFVFSKHDDIGTVDAEEDSIYLKECFIDTGDVDVALDCNNAKRLLVGRTGMGKSALIEEISNRASKVIRLSPHSLSLNFIANNKVIEFYESIGVNLSLFYNLLWKHILVVELLKNKFGIKDEKSQQNYTRHIQKILYKKDKIKEQAVDYLENWGNKFWQTTEERMHSLTDKISSKLEAQASSAIPGFKISATAAKELSSEQKKTIIEHGQKAVSEIQVRELENIISILGEDILNDRYENYYITVDMLDENWVDEKIKLKLILALINTSKAFKKLNNVKIIAALRLDLLNRVIHSLPGQGNQKEKYEDLYLRLSWNEKSLVQLAESRLNYLIRRKYKKTTVSFEEIFPRSVNGLSAFRYILDRTFLRPRDLIQFINTCIAHATDKPMITSQIIKHAEEEYSYKRLESLAYEWEEIHPNLKSVASLFSGKKASFKVSDITSEYIQGRYLELAGEIDDTSSDTLTQQLDKLYTNDGNFNSIRKNIIRVLYTVGLIGIKINSTASVQWSYKSRIFLGGGEIKPSSIIHIHPMFYRALDIHDY